MNPNPPWVARVVAALLAALAVLVFSEDAHAYAWMIRHDYVACVSCHADPSGGSLLTPYGRAQGEILLRTQYTKRAEDEEPSKVGNFLFFAPLPDQLLLGGDVRTMYMSVNASAPGGVSPPPLSRVLLMQADLAGEVRVDRFRANASLGYVHDGDAALEASVTRGVTTPGPSEFEDRLISRVHWVGVDLGIDKSFTLRAGRMNLPFGVRQIEHTLWVHQPWGGSDTRTDINSAQQHGVAFAYNGDGVRGEFMAIAGNYQLRPDAYRDRGYSGYLEFAPLPKLALGASSLIVHTDADISNKQPAWKHMHGVFGRYSPHQMVVIMLETNMLVFSQPLPASPTTQAGIAGMLQVDVEPLQGVHAIVTGELHDRELSRNSPDLGLWGSVQWFFAPHADVRVDGIAQSYGAGSSALTFLLQGHVFL